MGVADLLQAFIGVDLIKVFDDELHRNMLQAHGRRVKVREEKEVDGVRHVDRRTQPGKKLSNVFVIHSKS